ncbi:hypothetical protein GCM10023258_00030 [Terrabacter aeriphilus]|uniref:Uncharacterized protein n=1 Tax=Terrabacter aeriphilus TaxID=515662 RepID=A0ABP9IZ45_9MICO
MLGDNDARRDDGSTGDAEAPLGVVEELDPMDDAGDETDDLDDEYDEYDTNDSGDSDDQDDDEAGHDGDDDAPAEGSGAEAESPWAPVDATPAPEPPVTGDEAVDDATMRLAEAQSGTFAERIEAGEHAHRSLQGRLGGLGGA